MPRITSKLTPLFLVPSLATLLAGCGGGGAVRVAPHSYGGTWTGTVKAAATATTPASSGAMTLVIDTNDSITGTDQLANPGVTTDDAGSIGSTGALNLTVKNTGSTLIIAHYTGTLSVNNDTLVGSGTLTVGSTSRPVTFSLPEVISSGAAVPAKN